MTRSLLLAIPGWAVSLALLAAPAPGQEVQYGPGIALGDGAGRTYLIVDDSVPFPEEYRTWAHVKTVLVGPESDAFSTEAGIHHIYANNKALEGYHTGSFPDGSILVYDLLEANVVEGNTIEGAQRRVDVMVKDTRRYPDTGGWGFGRFMGTDRGRSTLSAERQAGCFACHSSRDERDYVFSEFRR